MDGPPDVVRDVAEARLAADGLTYWDSPAGARWLITTLGNNSIAGPRGRRNGRPRAKEARARVGHLRPQSRGRGLDRGEMSGHEPEGSGCSRGRQFQRPHEQHGHEEPVPGRPVRRDGSPERGQSVGRGLDAIIELGHFVTGKRPSGAAV
jgi:hypothetical protein